MTFETINLDMDRPLARLEFNRPKSYNAFNQLMRQEMLTAIHAIDDNPEVRCVILSGAGRGFSAGADLKSALAMPISNELDREYKPVLEGIWNSPKIWIAQVQGKAAGIGAAHALACDQMIMADDAALYLAFAAIALVPDGGLTWHLKRAMGHQRALEAIALGATISAADCVAYGFANAAVPADDLAAAATAHAQKFCDAAPMPMMAVKQLLRRADGFDLGGAISAEALDQNRMQVSQDCANAIAAFFQGKKPVFEGR